MLRVEHMAVKLSFLSIIFTSALGYLGDFIELIHKDILACPELSTMQGVAITLARAKLQTGRYLTEKLSQSRMQKTVQDIANIILVVLAVYILMFVATFMLFSGCVEAGYTASACTNNSMYRAVMFWQ